MTTPLIDLVLTTLPTRLTVTTVTGMSGEGERERGREGERKRERGRGRLYKFDHHPCATCQQFVIPGIFKSVESLYRDVQCLVV